MASADTKEGEGNQADETQDSAEPVSLWIVMYGDAGSRNVEFFKNEFHDKVLEDINIDMKVDLVPWGGGSDQIMTMAAAGEGFAFMSTVSEGYAYISKGLNAVFEEEMFDELAPNYKEARMGRGFDGAKYKGDILTIPGGAYPSSATNMWVRACPTWRRTAVVINREEGTITLNCEFKNNKLMVPKAVEEIYFC